MRREKAANALNLVAILAQNFLGGLEFGRNSLQNSLFAGNLGGAGRDLHCGASQAVCRFARGQRLSGIVADSAGN